MGRRKLVCGNWKLNHRTAETRDLVRTLVARIPAGVDVAVAPVAPLLALACDAAKGSSLAIAAQNVHFAEKGAFTGEWSVAHLGEIGVRYAIVGHSERRAMFGDTDATVARKVRAVLDGGLVPIACVGEGEKEREAQSTAGVIERQMRALLDVLGPGEIKTLVVAYEPIWAIGTGKTATPDVAEEVHALIRSMAGTDRDALRILYGGSVAPDNARSLLAEPDIDGALVGGASLQADSFLAIIDAAV
jgi:triosephosphate isomerase